MSEHPGRHGATQPRALISYAHTPSLVAANGLVTTGSIAMDRADAASAATRPRTGRATPAARQRPRRLWRRLGAAAVLTATLATGSALPAQAAASDAARSASSSPVIAQQQPATLTVPIQLVRSTASLPPRKGRG
ncbi:hypothetical protein [Tersicoccus sp. Bi-70]|uniref:hypothetical protein n=1 Tax=Tersicoccus sp. Bi-70 TaxID=1897634 RepID=UPI0009786C4F|nr:hypothetical protein [Tersicoccus sp. Bi-70]OMH34198.1 hypothetical protein BGP79_03405 [Tersicoccus sp. Bi-70]